MAKLILLYCFTATLICGLFSQASFGQKNIFPNWTVPGAPNNPPIEGQTVSVDGLGRVGIGTWTTPTNSSEDLLHIHGNLPTAPNDCGDYREAALRLSLDAQGGIFMPAPLPLGFINPCPINYKVPATHIMYAQLAIQNDLTFPLPSVRYSSFATPYDLVLSTPAPGFHVHDNLKLPPAGTPEEYLNSRKPEMIHDFDIILTSKNPLGALRFGTTPFTTSENTIADLERMTILNNGNVGIGTEDKKYSAGNNSTLPIRSPFQVGNITFEPNDFDPAHVNWGSIAYNNFRDLITNKAKRLDDGPVNGIVFEPSWGGNVNGSVYLFASPNGVANTTYSEGSSFALRPGKLLAHVWKPNPIVGQPDIYKTLFDYTFSTWNVAGNDLNNDGTCFIRDKVFIGKEGPLAATPPFGGEYKLAVNGSILAKEIVVDARTFSWSDFVFDPEYELMPIEELAQEIKLLGHLPEMPSASEVEQDGLRLGEFQAKLLQKIEELTLYVIELKKENNRLCTRIEKIEKTH